MTTQEETGVETCTVSCSLPSEDLTARLGELMNGLLTRVTAVNELPDGYALDFEDSKTMRGEIEDFIAFEKQCCAFMSYEVIEAGPQKLRLALTGPEGTKAFLSKLIPLVDTDADEERSGTLLKRAGVLGTVTAILGVICCATPALAAVMAALGLAGATGTVAMAIDTTAPLLLVASVALLFLGRWQQNRTAKTGANSGDCGC